MYFAATSHDLMLEKFDPMTNVLGPAWAPPPTTYRELPQPADALFQFPD